MKRIVVLTVVTSIGLPLFAQNNWILQKEKDGIKISNRHSATSSFGDIRVELDLPGSIDQLGAILMDVNRYAEWSYAVKKSRLVKDLGPGRIIYYNEIEVPWPATNRYFYGHIELKKNALNHSMELLAVNLPDYQPYTADLVKVPFTKGTWLVTTLTDKTIHVDYTLEMDPGGSVPSWVLNLFATKGPLETFENIKEKMKALNSIK